MQRDRNPIVRQKLKAIPLAARKRVVEWLEATAANAEDTARRMKLANQTIKDEATDKQAEYWTSIGQAARLFAYRLESARLGAVKAKKEA